MIQKIAKVSLLMLPIGLALLVANAANAQTPYVKELCPEALEWKGKYQALRVHEDSVFAVADRRIADLKKQLRDQTAEANVRLSLTDRRYQTSIRQNETLAANLDETRSRLQTTEAELRRYKPKTAAGKVLRKVRDGLAVAGGVTLVVVTLHFLPL